MRNTKDSLSVHVCMCVCIHMYLCPPHLSAKTSSYVFEEPSVAGLLCAERESVLKMIRKCNHFEKKTMI